MVECAMAIDLGGGGRRIATDYLLKLFRIIDLVFVCGSFNLTIENLPDHFHQFTFTGPSSPIQYPEILLGRCFSHTLLHVVI